MGARTRFYSLRTSPALLLQGSSLMWRGTGSSWLIRLWEVELVEQSLVTRVAGFIFIINFL